MRTIHSMSFCGLSCGGNFNDTYCLNAITVSRSTFSVTWYCPRSSLSSVGTSDHSELLCPRKIHDWGTSSNTRFASAHESTRISRCRKSTAILSISPNRSTENGLPRQKVHENNRSNLSAASCCMPDKAWIYTLSVVPTVECPSLSRTTSK